MKDSDTDIRIEGNELIKGEKVLVEIFNKYCINIVGKTSGLAQKCIGNLKNTALDKETVKKIIRQYERHPSILKIKELKNNENFFDFPKATTEEINGLLKT